jgi:hypothetical protein
MVTGVVVGAVTGAAITWALLSGKLDRAGELLDSVLDLVLAAILGFGAAVVLGAPLAGWWLTRFVRRARGTLDRAVSDAAAAARAAAESDAAAAVLHAERALHEAVAWYGPVACALSLIRVWWIRPGLLPARVSPDAEPTKRPGGGSLGHPFGAGPAPGRRRAAGPGLPPPAGGSPDRAPASMPGRCPGTPAPPRRGDPAMRTALYARVSTERQERQQTIDSQLAAPTWISRPRAPKRTRLFRRGRARFRSLAPLRPGTFYAQQVHYVHIKMHIVV